MKEVLLAQYFPFLLNEANQGKAAMEKGKVHYSLSSNDGNKLYIVDDYDED